MTFHFRVLASVIKRFLMSSAEETSLSLSFSMMQFGRSSLFCYDKNTLVVSVDPDAPDRYQATLIFDIDAANITVCVKELNHCSTERP